ncbi:MAG: VOC family protein [Caulobacterales bacterium]|nr:VOC family protein [Caulobacterales bacterium]
MTHLTTCLWFDGQAEPAARFYVSLFPDAKLGRISPRLPGVPGPSDVLTVEFELMGQAFLGLNGGPQFKFDEAISFQIPCETQAEIDRYWEALTADGGQPGPCGWCKDRFGVSWQVIPAILPKLMSGAKAAEVAQAFMQMGKFDIAALEKAAA